VSENSTPGLNCHWATRCNYAVVLQSLDWTKREFNYFALHLSVIYIRKSIEGMVY
jgi:hypothetical protein